MLSKKQKQILKGQYSSSLKDLKDMGFSNTTQNLLALQNSQGDLNNAVNWILANPMDEVSSEDEIEDIILTTSTKKSTQVLESQIQDEHWYLVKDAKLQENELSQHQDVVVHHSKLIFFGKNNEILEFDKKTNKIQKISVELKFKSERPAAHYNGKIYLFGGEYVLKKLKKLEIKIFQMNSLNLIWKQKKFQNFLQKEFQHFVLTQLVVMKEIFTFMEELKQMEINQKIFLVLTLKLQNGQN
jgi:hypothetical protein